VHGGKTHLFIDRHRQHELGPERIQHLAALVGTATQVGTAGEEYLRRSVHRLLPAFFRGFPMVIFQRPVIVLGGLGVQVVLDALVPIELSGQGSAAHKPFFTAGRHIVGNHFGCLAPLDDIHHQLVEVGCGQAAGDHCQLAV